MKPFFTIILLSVLVGVLSSCSNDNDYYPKIQKVEVINELPLFICDFEKFPEKPNLYKALLINSKEELNELLERHEEPENEQLASVDYSQYSLILVFVRTFFEKVEIDNSFMMEKDSKNSEWYYCYLMNFYESVELPEKIYKDFYTGIVVEKLSQDTNIKLKETYTTTLKSMD